jgi:HEAT repeat protein
MDRDPSSNEYLDLLDRLLDENTLEEALSALEGMCRVGTADGRAVTYLIPVARSPDPGTRRKASWLMGKLAQNKCSTFWPVEELNNLLHDEEAEVRENAAWAIGELTSMRTGGIGSIEHLNHLLDDATPSVRGMAAWALGRLAERMSLGFQSSLEPLKALSSDRYEGVRRSAAYALVHLKNIGVED